MFILAVLFLLVFTTDAKDCFLLRALACLKTWMCQPVVVLLVHGSHSWLGTLVDTANDLHG